MLMRIVDPRRPIGLRAMRKSCESGAIDNVFLSGPLVCSDETQAAIVMQHLPLHVRLTRAEQGCVSFEVRRVEDSLVWQVEEKFRDAAAFRAHQERVAQSDWGLATAAIARRYTVKGL